MMDRMGLGVVYHVANLIGETSRATRRSSPPATSTRGSSARPLGVTTGQRLLQLPEPAFAQPGFV